MALNEIGNLGSRGIALIVAAGIVYEIIAANCSSPQTTELNASARAETLMKYVKLGEVQAAIFIGVAAAYDKENAVPIIAGGVMAGVMMHLLYVHAKNAGISNGGQPTENYGV